MLNNSQKRFLKAQAHSLKPVVITGERGLTETVMAEIDNALNHHELIKVRINAEDREQREAMTAEIASTTGADTVQRIGHIVVLFRPSPDKPRIVLP